MSPTSAQPWIRTLRPDARLRLLCLPHAGGGTVDYRGWQDHFVSGVDVCPIVLPGRETRLSEVPYDDVASLVRDLARDLRPALRDVPFAIYGHSMGAWVAFELARELRRVGQPPPAHLFVAARRAPHVAGALPAIHDLPEPAFIAAIQARYAAIPEALLTQPRVLRMFLPALRADFTLLDTYSCADEPPLATPITAFVGTDDAVVDPARVARWKEQTEAAFTLRRIPGGHFFLRDSPDLLCDAVAGTLRAHL